MSDLSVNRSVENGKNVLILLDESRAIARDVFRTADDAATQKWARDQATRAGYRVDAVTPHGRNWWRITTR